MKKEETSQSPLSSLKLLKNDKRNYQFTLPNLLAHASV